MHKKEFWILVLLVCIFVLVVLGIVQALQVPVSVQPTLPALHTSTPRTSPTPGWWTQIPPFVTWTPTQSNQQQNAATSTPTLTPELKLTAIPSLTPQPSATFPTR